MSVFYASVYRRIQDVHDERQGGLLFLDRYEYSHGPTEQCYVVQHEIRDEQKNVEGTLSKVTRKIKHCYSGNKNHFRLEVRVTRTVIPSVKWPTYEAVFLISVSTYFSRNDINNMVPRIAVARVRNPIRKCKYVSYFLCCAVIYKHRP